MSDNPSQRGRARRREPRQGRHLTVADLCDELDISPSTFYDWRAKKKAPVCFRLPNGDLRIARDDFEQWLSSLRRDVA